MAELIKAARAAIEATDDIDLAVALRRGYGLRTGQSSVSRWRTAPRGPTYEAAFALMDAAGWIDRAAVARSLEPDAAKRARKKAREGRHVSAQESRRAPSERKRATG